MTLSTAIIFGFLIITNGLTLYVLRRAISHIEHLSENQHKLTEELLLLRDDVNMMSSLYVKGKK